MLSSSRVIKSNSTIESGKVEINTEYVCKKNKELAEKNAKDFIENYEVLARTMLENARKQGEELISRAYHEAQQIEEDAYRKGYDEGLETGYKEAYEKGVGEANEYYENISKQAQMELEETNAKIDKMFFQANQDYLNYLDEKKEDVKDLVITIAENILQKEIKEKDSIGNMILDAMEVNLKSKTVIVKARSEYIDDVKSKIEIWKSGNVFNGDVFVVADDTLDEGSAIIQRENGKIVVDAIKALDKVKEIMFSNDQ
ncbi:FliH/SctL family protein [Clostridium brassicae]|uniref:FliH protein n=1 Tax=Clostridium brassicae TaxID=2999072 RepID=A0ABT4DBD6_9CLOT|nr:fliH protein [Clostridium brassicae]MCY6959600.1 fliH protein [Clostridium brassicae]